MDIICACMARSLEWKPVGPPPPKLPPPKTREESLARLRERQKTARLEPPKELPDLPKSAAEARSLGWLPNERGWDCPDCIARKIEEAKVDHDAGANTQVGGIQAVLVEAGLAVETA